MTRWKRLLLYALIGIAAIAPPATFLGGAVYNELASSNSEDTHFKCYGCLESFAMISSNEGWGFGVGPYALQYQHGALTWEPGPDTDGIILSIAASSPQEVWGVGVFAIWRCNGTRWTNGINIPYSEYPVLRQASAVSPTDIWAVGDAEDEQGIIWRYNGTQWRQTDIVPSSRLASVSMVSADDGWAVGARYAEDQPQNGVLAHYQNGQWNATVTLDRQLTPVSMVSPTDGWAVGSDMNGNGVIYRYDGATWKLYTTEPDVALLNLGIANTGDAWVLGRSRGGESVLYHYEGQKWSLVTLPIDVLARSLYVGAIGDLWLAGETQQKDRDGFQQGMVLHDLEDRWQTLAFPQRPPNEPWELSPEYRFLAATVPVQWVMLIAFWCIGYIRGKLQFHVTNREIRGALIGTLSAFSASGLATLLLWIMYRDSPGVIPEALVKAITIVLTVLLALPMIYLAAPPLLMRWDGSFRWRRQT